MASRNQKFHGRIEGSAARCGAPGCAKPGEFRAPVSPGDFDGPGKWRYLCLDHVRAHNASYNFFNGMSPDEIEEAQSPIAGWERHSRPFASAGSDPPPAWSNFTDPLDAIAARFRTRREDGTRPGGSGWGQPDRFTAAERSALN
ncbi:MAG: molecular chaperone DnaJ, partial [Sphingomicrobium sp.]